MSVQDFYQRIKRDHETTWKFICEVNTKKLVKNAERINRSMLFTKKQIAIPTDESDEEYEVEIKNAEQSRNLSYDSKEADNFYNTFDD